MTCLCNLLKVHIFGKLHVLGVNAHDLHAANLIRDADINFTIEATSTTQGRVKRVGAVCRGDDDNLTAALGAVHESKELSDDSLLSLTITLLSVGCNRVNLINEDD